MLNDLLYKGRNRRHLNIVGEEAETTLWRDVVNCIKCAHGTGDQINRPFCVGCVQCGNNDASFITALNGWVNAFYRKGGAIKQSLVGKKDVESFYRALKLLNSNNGSYTIDHATLYSWQDGVNGFRDPRKKPNDPKPRQNFYKLCGIMGLQKYEEISDFFAGMIKTDAFARMCPFECIAEHFVLMKRNDWLEKTVNTFEKYEDKFKHYVEAEDGDEDDVAIGAIIGNSNISDSELVTALVVKYKAQQSVLDRVDSQITPLIRLAWTKLNEIDEGDASSEDPDFSELFRWILNRYGDDDGAISEVNAAKNEDLKAIGASRNFPSVRLLRKIYSGKANTEHIRKMIMLLVFAAQYGNDVMPASIADEYNVQRRERRAYNLIISCDDTFRKLGCHAFSSADGYDVFILYCCLTHYPIDSFRRILVS